jgi:ribosomal-protein-alanine N-acetyltransferase
MRRPGIERMELDHLEGVLSIERSSSLTPWSKEMFIEELRNPLSHCFIHRVKRGEPHSILGFICFRNMGEESELLNIGVHPMHRRMGIGKQLMQFYMDFCSERQIKSFYLEVYASNPSAIRLYRWFSYQPVGTRKKFYQGRFDALIMAKTA